jgi:hypothetical protein
MDNRFKLSSIIISTLLEFEEEELCRNFLEEFKNMWDEERDIEKKLMLTSGLKKLGVDDQCMYLVANILDGMVYTNTDIPNFIKAVDVMTKHQEGDKITKNFMKMCESFITAKEMSSAADELRGVWCKN